MTHYRSVGEIPPKRHTQHRGPDGALLHEELMGEEGFSADSSLLYHRHLPSAISAVHDWLPGDLRLTPLLPLRPLHLRTHSLFPDPTGEGVDAVTGRRLLLGNADVRLSYVLAGEISPYYRNAIGDECLYVESGGAVVETVFGDIDATEGDYVIVPRATTFRVVPRVPTRLYVIEANSHIGPPTRYLSRYGQLLEHATYCERDLRGPTPGRQLQGDAVDVHIKHRGRGPGGISGTVHTVPHHPFDVVGWDGCLYPYAFNISDFEPITGRVHQPPPAHQVFEGHNFVVCNFVPRKVDYHPFAIPVPYYHSNVDSDEVMFYCGGDYEARRGSGIGPGSISHHPGGHPHGPQPGAYERSIGVDFFDELAVMVDTFRPLEVGEGGWACDDGVYAYSWSAEARDGDDDRGAR